MSSMSPSESTITQGQIAKFLDLQTAALRKCGLPSELTQRVLEQQGAEVAAEFVQIVRKRVDAISDMIVHHVEGINRALTPQQVIDATGRTQYVNQSVLATMPQGEGDTADVEYFWLRRYASPAEVAEGYRVHGLKPDPAAQAKDNADNPSFADKYPNACQWQDAEGRWCYATFDRWGDGRDVYVYRDDDDWNDDWVFGGVRK